MKNLKTRKLNRLKGYNYSQGGWYFVTICVKNRIECLGEIKDEKMQYSQYGDIVLKYWQEIPNHYENVFLGQWVIMPNHIHGIIVIEHCVGTEHCSVPTITMGDKNPKYGLLSKIIKSFKEISLKTIRKRYNDYKFAWQRSFYDHIIRNEKSLNRIRQYIYYNPAKWESDRNNPRNFYRKIQYAGNSG